MKKVQIRQADVSHIQEIADNVRPEDKLELWDSHLITPKESMERIIEICPDFSLTGFINGKAVCMFGINPGSILSCGNARPWFIGTIQLEADYITFLRYCKPVFSDMCINFSYLENYVDARNTKAIRWLKWMGFEFDEAKPYGVNSKPFHRFYRG